MKVHLSDGEWKLMNKLWDASPRTITELTAALREESESVLEKVGSVGLLMSAMVESRKLTESDLAELSAILERAKEGRT